jgi:hypothetical protein
MSPVTTNLLRGISALPVVRNFHPHRFPAFSRPAYLRELLSWAFLPLFLGAIEGGALGVVVKKAFADSGVFEGFSCKARTTSHVPHATPPSTAATPHVRRKEVVSRHLPSRDIARGFTGWGISLQLRAVGALTMSLLTKN